VPAWQGFQRRLVFAEKIIDARQDGAYEADQEEDVKNLPEIHLMDEKCREDDKSRNEIELILPSPVSSPRHAAKPP
jgi:hypothetical protein